MLHLLLNPLSELERREEKKKLLTEFVVSASFSHTQNGSRKYMHRCFVNRMENMNVLYCDSDHYLMKFISISTNLNRMNARARACTNEQYINSHIFDQQKKKNEKKNFNFKLEVEKKVIPLSSFSWNIVNCLRDIFCR